MLFGKKKKDNASKENKKLSLAILCLSLGVYLVCVFIISRWYVQGLKIKYLSQDIINTTEIIEKEEDNNVPDEDNNSTEPDSNNNENGNSNEQK